MHMEELFGEWLKDLDWENLATDVTEDGFELWGHTPVSGLLH
jgi:hypothetical protein